MSSKLIKNLKEETFMKLFTKSPEKLIVATSLGFSTLIFTLLFTSFNESDKCLNGTTLFVENSCNYVCSLADKDIIKLQTNNKENWISCENKGQCLNGKCIDSNDISVCKNSSSSDLIDISLSNCSVNCYYSGNDSTLIEFNRPNGSACGIVKMLGSCLNGNCTINFNNTQIQITN